MKIVQTPAGTKDILPREAAELRHLEAAIRRVFTEFGYGEAITPTLETEDALDTAGERQLKKSFRLFDEHGDVLVMRPEMTVPIARLVATKMVHRRPPFRVCYFANSFSPTRPQRGKHSEFYQAGIELIGIDSPEVDAEVIAILCRTLDACGIDDYAIGIGEVSFFRALLDSAGVDDDGREAVFDTLKSRDVVELSRVVAKLDVKADDRDAIMEIATMRGGSEVLVRAQDLVQGQEMDAALKRLARTYYLLSRHGCAGHIIFDLGIFRNFAYYTGVVFEALCEGIGFPIGGGGRYNRLLARYGRPEPAVGFALGLDRLHIASTSRGGVEHPPEPKIVLIGGADDALELATELRESGVAVFSLPDGTDLEEAMQIALENDIGFTLAVEGDEVIVCERGTEGVRCKKAQLPGVLGA